MVVLKNCEPELSYVLVERFNKYLKESCSPYFLKVSPVVPIFKNIGEQSIAKNYCPVSRVKPLKILPRKMWPFF